MLGFLKNIFLGSNSNIRHLNSPNLQNLGDGIADVVNAFLSRCPIDIVNASPCVRLRIMFHIYGFLDRFCQAEGLSDSSATRIMEASDRIITAYTGMSLLKFIYSSHYRDVYGDQSVLLIFSQGAKTYDYISMKDHDSLAVSIFCDSISEWEQRACSGLEMKLIRTIAI